MSTFLVHPSVFSAYAAADHADPDLQRGTHLRLFPSTLIGFPLAPFALWHMPARLVRSLPFAWFDGRGHQLAELNLDQAEGRAMGWLTTNLPRSSAPDRRRVAIPGGTGRDRDSGPDRRSDDRSTFRGASPGRCTNDHKVAAQRPRTRDSARMGCDT
jgi:hypothetical protein